MVNKKLVIIITIIAIIVVGAIVGYGIMSLQETEYTFDEVSNNTIGDEENSIANNTVDENVVDENVVDKNATDENLAQQNTTTESNDNSASSEDPEEVAKSLAEQKWKEEGQNQEVYYYVEEQLSDNVYVISVRSKDTTAVLIDYEVNIETEEVSEY